jgi:hypothetical protein
MAFQLSCHDQKDSLLAAHLQLTLAVQNVIFLVSSAAAAETQAVDQALSEGVAVPCRVQLAACLVVCNSSRPQTAWNDVLIGLLTRQDRWDMDVARVHLD